MNDNAICPLRRRMTFLRPRKRASRRRVGDIACPTPEAGIRGITPTTQTECIRVVRDYTAFFGRSPDLKGARALSDMLG